MVHVFTQLNLKQGLKRFGKSGMKSTKSELQQMNNKVLFHSINGEQLTRKQKNVALQVIMFLEQKRYGKIKGRAVVDGRKKSEG